VYVLFSRCCISSVVESTDVDVLWDGSEQDGNVRSECEEDKGTDCEDGNSDAEWLR
jgi:hypothetical protein